MMVLNNAVETKLSLITRLKLPNLFHTGGVITSQLKNEVIKEKLIGKIEKIRKPSIQGEIAT
jgi:hypothetical protein